MRFHDFDLELVPIQHGIVGQVLLEEKGIRAKLRLA
jgi:hypothetical protein